jgi:CTP synthase
MMEEQKQVIDKGATMRLGSYECALTPGTHAAKAYAKESIRERHRHRFEVNNAYVGQLQRSGLMVSGINPRRNLVEIVELKNHPWFVAVQFHPEFQSKPNQPHPLFAAFIGAAVKNKRGAAKEKTGSTPSRKPAKKK